MSVAAVVCMFALDSQVLLPWLRCTAEVLLNTHQCIQVTTCTPAAENAGIKVP